MNTELKEIILQQCRKKVTPLELFDEEEEEAEGIEEKESEGMELPFEDILAEKRRRYSPKEEFIFLLYNDMLQYFVKEWDGRYLRKKPRRRVDDDSREISSDDENIDKEDDYDFEENPNGATKSSCPWKLTLPDEFANITFITNNTYSGRISRKMMEGEGVYRWSNGAQYKGEFEQNYMHGEGLLEWNSVCWYEGDFANGYRHGRGIMVDGEHRYMYTGQWHKDQRHGKGYSRYEENGSYDGDWTMDKMNGTGLRIYPSGARYVGQWRNGVRHGFGTMVWTNGDIYRGEWKCGAMDGYGIYVWNGFFNKTFTWPQEVSYVGYWRHGMRHGKGYMKLNSVGGAKYSGYWKNNKKHGYGIMIGNNGEKLESNSLFLNNIFCASDIVNNAIKSETEMKYEQKCIRVDKEKKPQFIEEPEQLTEALISPILKPEQFPCISYYITRLLDPKSLEPPLVISISSGKCCSCENESCSCLAPPTSIDTNEQNDVTSRNVSESHIENMKSNWKYEERWIYNCLTLHMFRIRRIYNDYAKLFTKSPPKCNLVMTRLCLWQLWRDCNIHEKGLSLTEIDTYIAKNETALVVDPHHPFERIEIWQFLHALFEVSWHLYTKRSDTEVERMNGKIAAGLHTFLENDVYPHAGNHVGNLCYENQDLLPTYCVFELYQRIGYPPTAKTILRSMCVLKGTTTPQSSSTLMDFIKNFPDGINSVTMGDKISYLLKTDGIFSSPQYAINVSKEEESDPFNGLLAFKQLGAPKMIKIMAAICPGIKDTNNGIIMNMDYKLVDIVLF